MVEIAISLAIIGIALVAIIGVLPLGINVQKDNREETIIDQDATVFIEAIRNGQRGLNDLTNYVYAVTNYQVVFPGGNPTVPTPGWNTTSYLTNGANIIGILSTPEFTDSFGNPTNNLFSGGYSNHIVAYVRSISGSAVEKPPQDNQILQQDSFGYRILCVNTPVAMDTNALNLPYNKQLAANLHELRLTFMWPQLPDGKLGAGRQTFRTEVAGQIQTVPINGGNLYFFQSQSFTNAP